VTSGVVDRRGPRFSVYSAQPAATFVSTTGVVYVVVLVVVTVLLAASSTAARHQEFWTVPA